MAKYDNKQGLYNIIITPSNTDPNSLGDVILGSTLDKLCETNNTVNLVHLGVNLTDYAYLNRSCVTFQELDLI